MKVWIENPFDNLPLEGFRPQRFWLMARAFAAAGHDVTYWTSDFSHSQKACRKLQFDLFGMPFPLKLVRTLPYASNVSLARVRSHRRYAAQWLDDAKEFVNGHGMPDLIVLSVPPLSTVDVAFALREEFGCKIVIDVMDAWPQTFARLLPRPLRWMHRAVFAPLSKTARRGYRDADLVTGVCDGYGAMVRSAGARSYFRAYHGISLPPAARMERHDELRLVYVGGTGRTYDLQTLVRALAGIDGATLTIAGAEGRSADALRALAASLGCADRLFTPGYLASGDLEELISRSDVGLVPMADESFVGIPYKFADYSAGGLAIVSSLGGESKALIDQYAAGATYPPSDVDGCIRAIREVATDIVGFKRRSRSMAESIFDAEKIYREYVAVVSRLKAVSS